MKIKSLLFIILILSTIFIVFNMNISYADGISDVISGGDSFIGAADDSTKLDETKLKDTSNMIYKILLILGICIAAIISGVLGIKFMIGSVEEKAQVKDQLIPFVVGCVVIFGAFTIWKIVVNIGEQVVPTQQGTTTTYTKEDDGTLKCNGCGDELGTGEQRRGKCSNCGKYIEGI